MPGTWGAEMHPSTEELLEEMGPLYLLIFGAGTIVGMMFMTAVMAVPLAYAGDRFANMSCFFSVASGLVSVSFGFFLVYQPGFLGGLFTSRPHWIPQ